MPQIRVYQVRGGGATGQIRVYKVSGAAGGAGRIRIYQVQGKNVGAFVVDAGLNQTVDPFQVVQLNAVVTTTGAAADSWVWIQTSGTPVTSAGLNSPMPGTGPSRAFRAPGGIGTDLTFQVAAASAGSPDAVDTTTVTVRSHTGLWMYSQTLSKLVAVEKRVTAKPSLTAFTLLLALGLYPSPTLFPYP